MGKENFNNVGNMMEREEYEMNEKKEKRLLSYYDEDRREYHSHDIKKEDFKI